MRSKYVMTTILIAALCLISFATEKQDVGHKVAERVRKATLNRLKVYSLDLQLTGQIRDQMDRWFLKTGELSGIQPQQKMSGRRVYQRRLESNSAILVKVQPAEGLQPRGSFLVRYVQDGMNRTFRKELRFPTPARLDEKSVIEMGKSFIMRHHFIAETDSDKIIDPLVAAWRSQPIKEEIREEEILTILQRVVFHRSFNGFAVVNSKITVDIHPGSKEILAYKQLNWSAVNEGSGKSYDYISPEEITKQIHAELGKKNPEDEVASIEQMFYETDSHLIPVLVVNGRRPSSRKKAVGLELRIIIGLLRDISFNPEEEEWETPEKAREPTGRASGSFR